MSIPLSSPWSWPWWRQWAGGLGDRFGQCSGLRLAELVRGWGLGLKETKGLAGLWLLLLEAGLGGVLGPARRPDLGVQ